MTSALFSSMRLLQYPIVHTNVKFADSLFKIGVRQLYAKTTLGLDNFKQQQSQVKAQMAGIADKFREKMTLYTGDDSANMIFTEDLKNMIHMTESDDDIELVVKMMRKFNQQNKQLRFGSYIFGPVVMRLFYVHNKVDLAVEFFKSEDMKGFFDQIGTYQILLDLLYENQRYDEILELFEIIKERQIEGVKYPRNVVVLTLAACYKLNTKDSWSFAVKLWKQLLEVGHFPMRRATTFMAGLALNQGQPGVALEVLESAKNQNYTTVRNLKVVAFTDLGRVEDALPILKAIISEDNPQNVIHTFNKDVLEKVKKAITTLDDAELALQINRLQSLFEKQGNISDLTLDEQLCAEIQLPPIRNNQQQNRFSRYEPRQNRREAYNKSSNYHVRPGLSDLL